MSKRDEMLEEILEDVRFIRQYIENGKGVPKATDPDSSTTDMFDDHLRERLHNYVNDIAEETNTSGQYVYYKIWKQLEKACGLPNDWIPRHARELGCKPNELINENSQLHAAAIKMLEEKDY